MKKFTTLEILLVLLIVAIPFAYAGMIYSDLPETIPTHFGLEGKADKYSSKDSIWLTTAILSVIAFVTYLGMGFLPTIDPKRKAGQAPATYKKIALVVVVFLTGINLTIIQSTKSASLEMSGLMLPLMGLFFAVLGNYMHSIKPNYFVGFRTPWTLENEDNWRKTHQLVSKIWVPGGLVIALGTFVLPKEMGVAFMLIVMIPMIIIPLVFSYRYYKKHQA